MKSPIILAAMLLASPAMAGQSVVPLEMYRPNFQYELEVWRCHARLTQLSDVLAQLKQRLELSKEAIALAEAPVPKLKPARAVKAKPKACPALKGRQKCKRGRWQSPKHNCKCGVW